MADPGWVEGGGEEEERVILPDSVSGSTESLVVSPSGGTVNPVSSSVCHSDLSQPSTSASRMVGLSSESSGSSEWKIATSELRKNK